MLDQAKLGLVEALGREMALGGEPPEEFSLLFFAQPGGNVHEDCDGQFFEP